ncbi:MAG: Ig-like domain-containing protein [Planctomycetota bacterium]
MIIHARSLAIASSLLLLAACGSSSGSGTTMEIVSCSLGCGAQGAGGFVCSVNQVAVNGQIAVEFSEPVDPASLNSVSFRVISGTGVVPLGDYVVDPANPRRALFLPTVDLSSGSSPQIGLDPGSDYIVRIPAASSASPALVVTSTSGSRNTTPLECVVRPTLGVVDPVPGAPTVELFIETIEPTVINGEIVGQSVVETIDLLGAEPGVPTSSRLRLEFDDVMNPSNLVNSVSGTSPQIEVRVDIDGDLADTSDQLAIPGTFTIDIDQTLGSVGTSVVFTPDGGFPTAGVAGAGDPRRVVLFLQNSITDLAGNGLANSGTFTFVTTLLDDALEDRLVLAFENEDAVDRATTGMFVDGAFSAGDATGRALRGLGGGSGRLGELRLAAGDELVLSTGPIPTRFGPNLTNGPRVENGEIVEYQVRTQIIDDGLYPIDPFAELFGNSQWFEDGILDNGPGTTTWTVTDGVFEFSSLTVEPGARVTLVGEDPARIFVRGRAEIGGLVRADGGSADPFLDALGELAESPDDGDPIAGPDVNGDGVADGFGGSGGAGGAGAGRGGDGADRLFAPGLVGVGPSGVEPLENPGGSFPWGAPGFADVDPSELSLDGSAGLGRGGAVPGGAQDHGAGVGGLRYPTDFPGLVTGEPTDIGDIAYNNMCESNQVGRGGTGGTYAARGGAPVYGVSGALNSPAVVAPPLAEPSTELLVASSHELDPARGGSLLGGAGGGGGGAGIGFAMTNALAPLCSITLPGAELMFSAFYDARGGGGGGGGGAIQLQAGAELSVGGVISARGGDGGGFDANGPAGLSTTAPGGGGSGGALLLQALQIELATFPGVLDVTGGAGGFTRPTNASGGAGGPGIVQLENGSSLVDWPAPFPSFAPEPLVGLEPTGDGGVTGVGSLTSPTLTLADDGDDVAPFFVDDILRVGGFEPNATGPGARVGLQSCWLDPADDAFNVTFGVAIEDDPLAWDVQLELAQVVPGAVVSWRGDPGPLAALTGGQSLETVAGNILGASPLVVRFQGARRTAALIDPCEVFDSGPASPFLAGSLTPWLSSPAEVSEFWSLSSAANPFTPDIGLELSPERQVDEGLAAQRRANVIRVQVILDLEHPLGELIASVVELQLGVEFD